MRFFVLILFFTLHITAQQTNYPQDYFGLPLEIPLDLSATFGELRHNHFHSGIDFKTEQREGLNVFATGDGFVSRIKISVFGYGKAIYITHPNGFTSVYGHIQKFSPKIEAYLKEQQYKKKSYEVELFPKAAELPIIKGEIIALSGNSGSSGGPHLHFEYRDTQTENTINPFYFGLNKAVADTKAAVVLQVLAYPITDSSLVNQSRLPVEISLIPQKDGSYIANPIVAKGSIGFGIDAYDIANASNNRNGLYKVETFINGQPTFEYLFDQFSFTETRYINAFIDYKRYIEKDYRIQKLFVDNSIKLSLLKKKINNGIVDVLPNLTQNYRIDITDFHGNKTQITIPITFGDKPIKIKKETAETKGYFLKAKNDNNLALENVSVFIPANSLYSDCTFNFEVTNGVAKLHDTTLPVQSNITLTFDVSALSAEQLKGVFIAEVVGKKMNYCVTKRKGKTLSTKIKTLGNYTITTDNIAPSIKLTSLKEAEFIADQKQIVVEIKDELSGITTFNGFLNNQWILMEYDFKTNRLVYDVLDNALKIGKNDLKIIATDNVGNTTTLETFFNK